MTNTRRRPHPVPIALRLAFAAFTAISARADRPDPSQQPKDLTQLSLEDLLKVQVTSPSRKEQTLSRVGAAVHVITPEDILSSGAHSIPDLLRLVPGVDVAQIDSNQWAISIRGFNALFANKLLVLIDGRSVYTPITSEVSWEQLDVPLEDIERIEVIRGPGGTVWGANAVNGVINIITRKASDTGGGLITAGAGSRETGEGLVQYGGSAGSKGAYRVFGKYSDTGSSVFPDGRRAADGWRSLHGGFRADMNPSARDALTLEGDVLTTPAGGTEIASFSDRQPFQAPVNIAANSTSANILGRWTRTLAGGSQTSLQIYSDYLQRDGQGGSKVSVGTLDLNFNHHLSLGARHDVVWGLDYRLIGDEVAPYASYSLRTNPPGRTTSLFGVFFQDEVRLTDSLFFTFGSKFEHNAYTGFEYEPSVQLVWTGGRNTVWASAARAIRQPSSVDFGAQVNIGVVPGPSGTPALLVLLGSDKVVAEQLYNYEAGYRAQINPLLSLDLSAFVSYYHHLENTEPGPPFPAADSGTPYLVFPLTSANLAHARDYGLEVFSRWSPNKRWKLSPGYSFLQMRVATEPGSGDFQATAASGQSPKHQFQLRSSLSLSRNVEWNCAVRYVSALTGLNVPAYTGVDTNLKWCLRESLEVPAGGQNLLTPRRLEFLDTTNVFFHTEVQRSAFVKGTWRF